tara:strand:- start:34109 stop:34885 length:777 start_codon:yes stop_codon:yes gene_type:complete
MDNDNFLPGLPVDLIRAAYLAAPGNEIESGKFASPESSAALVANTFGLFLDRPEALPSLPGTEKEGWPAKSVTLEGIVRFPWSGGRHPCLDVLIETETALIGVESKRYEPYRSKSKSELSDAYWRPVWGESMCGYEHLRDGVRDNPGQFARLDAAQLVKHAFGLRTAAHRDPRCVGKKPILFYLYAEPSIWPDGREISKENFENHRNEISSFQKTVSDDEVSFVSSSYHSLLQKWSENADALINEHMSAVAGKFDIPI